MMNTKRIDQLEQHLTPKEWAIHFAGELRRHPDSVTCLRAWLQGGCERLPGQRAHRAFKAQTRQLHSGKRDENSGEQNELGRSLQTEFNALLELISEVNQAAYLTAEMGVLKAGLCLSTLQSIILQDAFGRTARRAALWIEKCPAAGTNEERRALLDELAVYAGRTFNRKARNGGDPSRILDPQPALLFKACAQNTRALAAEVFSHQTAVRIIQDRCFDGHPILYLDAETGLEEVVKLIGIGVALINEYVEAWTQDLRAGRDWKETGKGMACALPDEYEEGLDIHLDAIRSEVAGPRAAALADKWMKVAKADAKRMEAEVLADRTTSWEMSRRIAEEIPGCKS